MGKTKKDNSPDFLNGGGEMGERIRHFDWSATPLGDPENWEQSLKTCVRIMLTSSQPIWIGWGKQLIKLYNDPYKAIVGGKHPEALGQPASVVWKDIWKDIEQMLHRVMTKNEGTYVESQLLIMERYGYPEETYYTFSYSPIPGENGGTAGMLCYNTADTERVINERALDTLRQLNKLVEERTEENVYKRAAQVLELNNKDFPFAVFYKVGNKGDHAIRIASAGVNKNNSELPEQINLKAPGIRSSNIIRAVTENVLITSENKNRWKQLPIGGWDVMPEHFVHIPIKAPNKPLPHAILTVGLNPYRKFDSVYENFIQLIADQVSLAVNNILAYEEERKQAEALKELDKSKTVFFSNISHEFRTPITLMLGTIEEALHDESTIPANKERLTITHRNAMRLLKLVNTLLDFSRIESGRQHANYILTDIAKLTKNLAGNFRSLIEKGGLKFSVIVDDSIGEVNIDRQMWEKIVFNLLSNSYKYTLQGAVLMRLYQKHEQLILEVEDTGVGIPDDDLPFMFERFHRVEKTVGRTYEGTGIGLSLVKELVQLHKGTIGVRSKEGEGTIFTVEIPKNTEHLKKQTSTKEEKADHNYINEVELLSADETPNPKDDAEGELFSYTVLVVDDNADMRQHIRSVLQKRFKVLTAVHGKDALQILEKNKIDLILSDIMMPVMDGIQLIKEIKKNLNWQLLPVILLTARAGEESRSEGLETGADDYLVKPFSAPELLARIKTQIDISKRREEIEMNLKQLISEKISELKNKNKELEHTQFFLQQLIDSSIEFISVLDENLNYIAVNKKFEQVLNKTAAELYGKNVFEVNPAAKDTDQHTYLLKALKGETNHLSKRSAIAHPDIFIDTYFVPYIIDEEIKGVIILSRDVSEIVKSEMMLEQKNKLLERANKELESFNYVASHDLQEPLRKIQSFIDLLENNLDQTELRKRYMDKIVNSSMRMSALIRSVLNYNSLSNDLSKYEQTNLNVIVSDVLIDFELVIEEKNANIIVGELGIIEGISSQMRQLFSNLISNSLKFCRTKPVIRITAAVQEEEENNLVITFSDNGIGFSNAYKEKIFGLFQRLHGQGEYPGTGIGLGIVKRVIENHKGSISADSVLDEGATFTITLPIKQRVEQNNPKEKSNAKL